MDFDTAQLKCQSDHFCFTHEELPYCGNCQETYGPGCLHCGYDDKCTMCDSGYMLTYGMCMINPW